MKTKLKLLTASLLAATAFDNKGWKMTADGKSIEMKDGNPIWIDADGTEKTLGAEAITRLNSDAKTLRIAKEKAEADLAKFAGITDPAKALEALELISKIDQKKLIDAGKVDEVKAEITKQYVTQIGEKDKALNELQSKYDNSQIANFFSTSEFLRERIAVPRDMFEATFRQNIKLKDGKFEFYGKDGNQLMSKQRIGEYANGDEALELMVESHPQKDAILKANGSSGSGGNGNGGNRGGGRRMTRKEFDALDPMQRAETAGKVGKGELQIVD